MPVAGSVENASREDSQSWYRPVPEALEKRSGPRGAALWVLEVVPCVGEAIGEPGRQRGHQGGCRQTAGEQGRRLAGHPCPGPETAANRKSDGDPDQTDSGADDQDDCEHLVALPGRDGVAEVVLEGISLERGRDRESRSAPAQDQGGEQLEPARVEDEQDHQGDPDLDRAASREGVEGGQSHHRQCGRRQGLRDQPP